MLDSIPAEGKKRETGMEFGTMYSEGPSSAILKLTLLSTGGEIHACINITLSFQFKCDNNDINFDNDVDQNFSTDVP